MLDRTLLITEKLLKSTLLSFFLIASAYAQEADTASGGGAEENTTETTASAESSGGDAASIELGKSVFEGNCTQCHAFDKVVVGPNLTGAHTRWPSKSAMEGFIKYPQKVIDGGNAYAKGLYDTYKQYMPNHDFLSDDELNGLYDYIVEMTDNPPAPAGGNVASGDQAVAGTGTAGGGIPTEYLVLIIGILLVILMAVIISLTVLLTVMKRFVNNSNDFSEEDREFTNPVTNWGALFKSGPFVKVATFVFIIILAKTGIDVLFSIGVQQGYAPSQPISFSHKLHAGMYEIDCQYCHTGVNKSKSANIPSANICMNCHNAVKTTSPEIQKIWKAVENDQPIEWVRVHNLPDLAYFNHSQHVNVAGLECQTCHGPIQEMEVVQQYSPLTMGWCINCHRETAVNTEGNEYYEKLIEFHERTQDDGVMTVEDIGGLECAKCHY